MMFTINTHDSRIINEIPSTYEGECVNMIITKDEPIVHEFYDDIIKNNN